MRTMILRPQILAAMLLGAVVVVAVLFAPGVSAEMKTSAISIYLTMLAAVSKNLLDDDPPAE